MLVVVMLYICFKQQKTPIRAFKFLFVCVLNQFWVVNLTQAVIFKTKSVESTYNQPLINLQISYSSNHSIAAVAFSKYAISPDTALLPIFAIFDCHFLLP